MISIFALDPFTLKEITTASRRTQTYVTRGLYVGLIGLVVYWFWSGLGARVDLTNSSEYANLGRDLFQRFVPFQMLLVSIAAVGAAADRIVREVQSGTLGLLLLTPVPAKRIVYAKYKGALAQAFSLIFCGLPVMAICVFLGGVSLEQIIGSFCLNGSMAALGAAFGIRASSLHPTVPKAMVMGLLAMLGYTIMPIALVLVGGFAALIAAPFLHPVYALFSIMETRGLVPWMHLGWITATIFSALVSWWLLRGCAPRIRGRVLMPPPAPPAFVYEQPVLGRMRILLKRGDRPSTSHREVWENDPLLWKELLTRTGAPGSTESRTLAFAGVLFLAGICWLFTKGESLGTFVFLGIFFEMIALASGVTLFTSEKESRRMEMLLSAPVTAGAILRAKLLAGLLAPGAIRMLLLAGIVCVAFSWWSGLSLLLYPAVLFTHLFFVYMLSAAASLRSDTTQGAALGASSVLGGIFFILPILATVMLPRSQRNLLGALNPVWILEPLSAPGTHAYESLARFLLFFPIHAGAALALGLWMLFRFDRILGRA